MGFFTGFASGFALTTSILLITVQVHRSNRIQQRKAISAQVEQINWLTSSIGAYDRRNLPADVPRRRREEIEAQNPSVPTMKEILKQKWNSELEVLTRKAYETRWEDMRDAAIEGWKAAARVVKRD
ncbi:hypothetical protein PENANT_c012G03517 [Penicillium antarcticum]|uniref:MICOS complex subunit MIC12 n=1 Tax=Penicillium antarcticum TaxID=416450 RepID=A0A1V6Q5T3_9EURO|nr:uncharacterized protein N7508_008168 [Penicillium antarcticum]KAJ5297919.1 hypothetical protein N7508_008168 [Penicillium antarcticum]OQD84601.1 hypothetical protein PENANT_c012G03517 [Penicillium antarcticum]